MKPNLVEKPNPHQKKRPSHQSLSCRTANTSAGSKAYSIWRRSPWETGCSSSHLVSYPAAPPSTVYSISTCGCGRAAAAACCKPASAANPCWRRCWCSPNSPSNSAWRRCSKILTQTSSLFSSKYASQQLQHSIEILFLTDPIKLEKKANWKCLLVQSTFI